MGQSAKKILIAIDDSPISAKAARAGFELAHIMHGQVAIVYVIDTSKQIVNADLGITPQESEVILDREAEWTIDRLVKTYDDIQEVLAFKKYGIPEQEILSVAKEWEADMIVMGTHGRSALRQILSGSTAEYVVRHATVPVVLTPPHMD